MQTPSQILAARVVAKLLETGKTLATAESCTGGLIAARITDVPGCSSVFFGGCVTYTNEIKEALLGVGHATITMHTEISAETAREMAQGARKRLGTDLAVSTTGIAGPGGGTPEHPVGTVYIALSTKTDEKAWRLDLGDIGREAIRERTVETVLQKLLDL